jgi:hypothetical protein
MEIYFFPHIKNQNMFAGFKHNKVTFLKRINIGKHETTRKISLKVFFSQIRAGTSS